MSLVLFPPPPLRQAPVLTAWAAVSVCELILRTTGIQARIKWPNDVLIRGRKVCGILIEQGRATVAGIGLNVNQPASFFEQAGMPLATSLAIVTGQARECGEVARQLIGELDEQYERLCQGDFGTLEAFWKRRLGLVDKHVVADCSKETYYGRLRQVTFAGVELELPEGKLLRLSPESLRRLQESGEPGR
jgi:BirA family biotin operon repressor/biotin-[acetyl-CoA-carboxylase] ligase